MATARPRVAITGMGVKSPAGNDLESFWTTLLTGGSAGAPITAFDASEHPVPFACEVRNFDPEAYLGAKESRRVDRVGQLGYAAAVDALPPAARFVRSLGSFARSNSSDRGARMKR